MMNGVDIIVRYDKGVGTYSVEPHTPEAQAWLHEQSGQKGTIDSLNFEGVKEYAMRARKDGFKVNDAELPRLATPDRAVRPQIEAIKAHLLAEGLADIEESLTKTSEGFHTISAVFDKKDRRLRVSYEWMSDHTPQEAVAWLQDKEIARSLKGDDYEITIHDKGTVQGKM